MILKRFFEEVFEEGIYNPVKELGNVNVVIDAGAATGEFSLWQEVRANTIYAIEGFDELYKHLVENVSDFSKINPFNIALGGENKNAYMAGEANGGARLSEEETQRPIQVKTLATFMKENNIDQVDVLKIDIEDGEREVFHAPDFPADKIKFIIGEHVPALAGEKLISLGFQELGDKIKYYKK